MAARDPHETSDEKALVQNWPNASLGLVARECRLVRQEQSQFARGEPFPFDLAPKKPNIVVLLLH